LTKGVEQWTTLLFKGNRDFASAIPSAEFIHPIQDVLRTTLNYVLFPGLGGAVIEGDIVLAVSPVNADIGNVVS
jgi:hypothetical protein